MKFAKWIVLVAVSTGVLAGCDMFKKSDSDVQSGATKKDWKKPDQPAESKPAKTADAKTGEKPKSKNNPVIVMDTQAGKIVIELYPDKAPKTVENFLKYVDEGYYDNTIFHRVMKNFMIQGGGVDAGGKEKSPKYRAIRNEADNGLTNKRGTIAMARTGDPHSARAQFFINHFDNASLDHTSRVGSGWGYCVFGRVIDGIDVVDIIAVSHCRRNPNNPNEVSDPIDPTVVKSVRRLKK